MVPGDMPPRLFYAASAGLLDYIYPPEPRKSPEKKKSSGQKILKLKTQVKAYPIPKQSHFRGKHPKNRRVLVRKL